jgi:hypothetical protein
MSNRAIITIASNLPDWWYQCVKPRFTHYANKCGAELVVISPPVWNGMMTRQITADYVMKYDRSLVLDADTVISRDAPSIFDVHPAGKVYMASDSEPGDPDADRQHWLMVHLQAICGPIGWTKGYGNAGVILCDWNHSDLWREWVDLPSGYCPDQANLNYRLRRKRPEAVGLLGREWNSFGLNTPLTEAERNEYESCERPIVYNASERIPDICQGAHIAHAAGFVHAHRDYAIRLMDIILP